MLSHSYFFENSQLLNLFVSAFDDAFVYRYDALTRKAKEKINVRYINGPKHRVLADLNDRAKNMTLPVVTIEQTTLQRDSTRIFNKDQFIYRTGLDNHTVSKIPTPIPVSMEVSVSIIAYFKEDLDQIIQNFVVNCNPYIIVSWKTPEEFELSFLEEIRSEIQWSGSVSYNNPKDLSPDTKWRISADTTFTIKGWLFKSYDQPHQAPIYKVTTDFIASTIGQDFCQDNYLASLSGDEMETVSISAYPTFTNVYYSTDSINIPLYEDLTIKKEFENRFLFYGKRFDWNNSWYLSANSALYTNFELISTAKSPFISAFKLPESWVEVESDNVARLTIPMNSLSGTGIGRFITANDAGWGSVGHSIVITT